jgi:hypothetical protein
MIYKENFGPINESLALHVSTCHAGSLAIFVLILVACQTIHGVVTGKHDYCIFNFETTINDLY